MQKVIQFKTKGMQRDLSASAFNSEFSYENKNIRIVQTDDNTLLNLTNEKGNKGVSIEGIGNYLSGIPIGQAVIDDELVVFTCGDKDILNAFITAENTEIDDITMTEELISDIDDSSEDRIYKLWFNNGVLTGKSLFEGNLNFDYKYPIETLTFYENNELKKVYWTDGLNQPRVINIAAASDTIKKWNNESFNFVRKLNLQEDITIERNEIGGGSFAPGVLQYVFTYYDKYGQESNIFYASPLYYTSYNNRGASAEDKVSNSFKITIKNVDENFDYIRVYSILRTSIDATPEVKRVVDLDLKQRINRYTFEGSFGFKNIKLIDRSTGLSSFVEDLDVAETTEDDYSDYDTWNIEGATYSAIGSQWEDTTITLSEDNKIKIVRQIIYVDKKTSSAVKEVLYTISDDTNYFEASSISYVDNGLSGDSVDPTELLYVGGEEVVFGTLTQKDNTLFLGDIEKKVKEISQATKKALRFGDITFSASKTIPSPAIVGYYPYNSQLNKNSTQIKTFKYLEYYRFGIQAQHYTGKWSEPIWINDAQNTAHIETTFYNDTNISLPVARYVLKDTTVINELIDNGYVKIRPVIVYPKLNDREVVCQGILCPTVYNVTDRYSNSPYAQSSWFTRPNAPFDFNTTNSYEDSSLSYSGDWRKLGTTTSPSLYSKAGILANESKLKTTTTEQGLFKIVTTTKETVNVVSKGAFAEFRHNYPIPDNGNRNAEIQCISNPPTPYISTDDSSTEWASSNNENYYIDQSVLTFHSPDIEFDNDVRSVDTSGLKLRIVGMVPITACATDIDIQTSTPVNNFKDSSDLPQGFYKEPVCSNNGFGVEGDSHFGWKGLISGAFWFDEITGRKSSNSNKFPTAFVVYPWHRNGSLNNTKFATDGYRSAMLDKKKMSNLRYSYKTVYLDTDNIWNAYIKGDKTHTGISGVSIFDSNEVSLIRLPAPENSNLESINYYGNVDKLLTMSREGDKKDGYPIKISYNASTEDYISNHLYFSKPYTSLTESVTDQYMGVDPIRIKYKSTPHAVLALNYSSDGNKSQRILPTIYEDEDTSTTAVNDMNVTKYSSKMFWDKDGTSYSVSQDILKTGIVGDVSSIKSIQYGWLWLGELYNDNVQNRFGGQSEEAFENNQWIPCGPSVSLFNYKGAAVNWVAVEWTEGDTYYQRYDHLKTYPSTLEDQNAVTDIVSFMCETRVNIDGRYDRNRGQTSNLSMTPTNFNLLNNVYSQSNNFFTYRTINPNKLNLNDFHNTITWTKTKTAGELTDTWTNITLASTLDLDGDKGKIRALRRFNDNIIAFQDKGISQILYNENMQISSAEGVPIEIGNSGKVNGKRYISDKIGCTNKWSLCETPGGIYFMDDINKGIYLFNGQLSCITDSLGFGSWISKTSKLNIWNPVDFDSFVTYYDKINGDVFFINKNECLAYSEALGQFSSFYSYEKTPYFINLLDRGIALNTKGTGTLYRPWLHNEGDYNMFFGSYQPFYTTVIANPDMPVDKIFDNLEFRADSWDKDGKLLNTTFDTLDVWNEYQSGSTTLTNALDRPSSLKKKFRIWRANIPRDKSNNRDRMRNPWLYLKLSMNKTNTNKTTLHDMIVHYFE